jgi:hypothetical protein
MALQFTGLAPDVESSLRRFAEQQTAALQL